MQDAKNHQNSPSAHHRTTLSNYDFATEKNNLLNSNISPTCPYNMVNFGPLAAEIGLLVWGTHPSTFQRVSRLGSVTARHYWASAKLCGVEQRTPPIFGRAAITLGIGPHSSLVRMWGGGLFDTQAQDDGAQNRRVIRGFTISR